MSSPTLTLTTEPHGDTVIVHLHGKLVAGCGDCLYPPVTALFAAHHRIILDLKDLTHMDSMGIGQLLRLYASAKTHHRTLELKNLGNRIRELMIMTNLLPVFSIVGEHNLKM
jgi:anti-anti-sigma factor